MVIPNLIVMSNIVRTQNGTNIKDGIDRKENFVKIYEQLEQNELPKPAARPYIIEIIFVSKIQLHGTV